MLNASSEAFVFVHRMDIPPYKMQKVLTFIAFLFDFFVVRT